MTVVGNIENLIDNNIFRISLGHPGYDSIRWRFKNRFPYSIVYIIDNESDYGRLYHLKKLFSKKLFMLCTACFNTDTKLSIF